MRMYKCKIAMEDSNKSTRRRALKASAAGLIGLTGIGSAQASGSRQGADEPDSEGTARASGTDSTSDNRKHSKRDYEQDLESLDFQSAIGTPSQQIGTMMASGDPTREHLEYLDHRKKTDTLKGITKIADVEWMLTAWEAIDDNNNPLTDSNGDYYYVLEHLAVSDEQELAYNSNPGQTEYLLVEAELSSTASMEGRDPRTTHSVNGSWVTVSAGATVDGTGVSMSTEQWVEHGDYGPESWTPGPGGKYGVMFDGETPGGGQTDIIGFSSVTSSVRASNIWDIIDRWSWDAKGNHIRG